MKVEPKWVTDGTTKKPRPHARSWTWIPGSGTVPFRPREILVIRIVLPSRVVVHWFEIEGELPHAHAAILVRFVGEDRVQAVVKAITAGSGKPIEDDRSGADRTDKRTKLMFELGVDTMVSYHHHSISDGSLSIAHATSVLRGFETPG